MGGQVTRRNGATSSSRDEDALCNQQKAIRGGRDCGEGAGEISMETLNLLQWVPLGIGTDQVLRKKSDWYGHSRILAARAACSEVGLSRPAIQHTRKMALK